MSVRPLSPTPQLRGCYSNGSQRTKPPSIQANTSSHCCWLGHDLLWLMGHLQTQCNHRLKQCVCIKARPLLPLFGTLKPPCEEPGLTWWSTTSWPSWAPRTHQPGDGQTTWPSRVTCSTQKPAGPAHACGTSQLTPRIMRIKDACFKLLHFEAVSSPVTDTMAFKSSKRGSEGAED